MALKLRLQSPTGAFTIQCSTVEELQVCALDKTGVAYAQQVYLLTEVCKFDT